jgi:hypothetical protein
MKVEYERRLGEIPQLTPSYQSKTTKKEWARVLLIVAKGPDDYGCLGSPDNKD